MGRAQPFSANGVLSTTGDLDIEIIVNWSMIPPQDKTRWIWVQNQGSHAAKCCVRVGVRCRWVFPNLHCYLVQSVGLFSGFPMLIPEAIVHCPLMILLQIHVPRIVDHLQARTISLHFLLSVWYDQCANCEVCFSGWYCANSFQRGDIWSSTCPT